MVRTGNKLWFDVRCVLAHRAKRRAYRVWSHSRTHADCEDFRVAHRRAQLVFEDAEPAFAERSKSILTTAPSPRKWWSTVKATVFGASSSLPPLSDREAKLIWSADEKASMFSAPFDAKQCRVGFSSRNHVTLLQYYVLLPSGLVLLDGSLWWI